MNYSTMFAGNPIFLARESSNLDKMESAFLSGDGLPHYGVALGLGAASRVRDGVCMDRHFNTGYCWGEFEGEHTRFLNAGDHNTSCALSENELLGSVAMKAATTDGVNGNYLSTYASMGTPQAGSAQGTCSQRSYGLYNSCPNCSLSGASVYQCNLSNENAIWATNPTTC
jgi:hypothetical protein